MNLAKFRTGLVVLLLIPHFSVASDHAGALPPLDYVESQGYQDGPRKFSFLNHVGYEIELERINPESRNRFYAHAQRLGIYVSAQPNPRFTGEELNKLKQAGVLPVGSTSIAIDSPELYRFVGNEDDWKTLNRHLLGAHFEDWKSGGMTRWNEGMATKVLSTHNLQALRNQGIPVQNMFKRIGSKVAPVAVIIGTIGAVSPAQAARVRNDQPTGGQGVRLKDTNVGSTLNSFDAFEAPARRSAPARPTVR